MLLLVAHVLGPILAASAGRTSNRAPEIVTASGSASLWPLVFSGWWRLRYCVLILTDLPNTEIAFVLSFCRTPHVYPVTPLLRR